MQTRMSHPAVVLSDIMPIMKSLMAATFAAGAPPSTLSLAGLRVSQLNGCDHCVEGGTKFAAKAGESLDRLSALSDWQHASCFSDSERAALALAEAVTLNTGERDLVPEPVWREAARHFDEKALAALLLCIGAMNMFNRVNRAIGLTAGMPALWEDSQSEAAA